MKFKYLIIAFTIIIVFFLLVLVMLPFLVPDTLSENLRYMTLPLTFFMVFVLICLGIFFLFNYRLLSLLEREDWPALAYYLEQKILIKGNYSSRKVRLLASSYMVISDYPSVLKLESKALLVKPSVIEKNALIFGSARVLNGKYDEAAVFFNTHCNKGRLKGKNLEWIRWFYGFTNLLNSRFAQAEEIFLSLAASSRYILITGISAYFLSNNLVKYSLNPEECKAVTENGRNRVVTALVNAEGWKKEVEKMADEIHIAIIRKYIDEAGIWLFKS